MDIELLRINPTLLTGWRYTSWLRQVQDGGRPSGYWKVAALLLFIMPAHNLMYRHMCYGNNNRLKIHPKGMATLKNRKWVKLKLKSRFFLSCFFNCVSKAQVTNQLFQNIRVLYNFNGSNILIRLPKSKINLIKSSIELLE